MEATVVATAAVAVTVRDTDDVMLARRARAVPPASSSPSSAAASGGAVVLPLLKRLSAAKEDDGRSLLGRWSAGFCLLYKMGSDMVAYGEMIG